MVFVVQITGRLGKGRLDKQEHDRIKNLLPEAFSDLINRVYLKWPLKIKWTDVTGKIRLTF